VTALVTAERLVKFAARRAETIFKRKGQVLWMYHYVCEDGNHGLFVPPAWCTSKDQIVAAAKALFEKERVIAYVFINEVWTLEKPERTREQVDALLKQYGSLEHVPGRVENVLLMGEDAKGMVYGKMVINRPEGREPYLSKLEIQHPDSMEGRMIGLLPQRGTRQ
jgi:hypothetical protein